MNSSSTAFGTRGGIVLAWDATMVTPSNPYLTEHTLMAPVQSIGGLPWWITEIYGLQLEGEKIEFLGELFDIRDLHARTWAVVGDFNLILNPKYKSNNALNRRL